MIKEEQNWKRICRHVDILRVYGGLTMVAGLIFMFMFFANRGAKALGGHDLSGFIYMGCYFTVLGIGLLFRLKIVAMLFSLTTGAVGLWLGVGSLPYLKETPAVLLNLFFAIPLLAPAWLTVRGWKALK